MKLDVEFAGAETDAEIEDFLARACGSLIYYTPAYRRFLGEITESASALTLIARDGGRIVGLLPAFVKKNSQYGDVLNSLPFFGGHGGAIVDEQSARQDEIADTLYGVLAEFIDSGNFASVTVVENLFCPMTEEQGRMLGCKVVDDRIGQLTRLPAGSDDPSSDIFSILHQKTRNSIRKGQQLGLTFTEHTDAGSLAWLQAVHEESIISLGGVAKPLAVFEALTRCLGFGSRARLHVAYHGETPAAGILLLMHGTTVEYFTPVVAPAYRDRQALSALIFHCMCTLTREGFTLWNWGGTWRSQEGVYRFKDRWGAEQRVYRYFNRVLNHSLLERDPAWLLANFPWLYLFRFK